MTVDTNTDLAKRKSNRLDPTFISSLKNWRIISIDTKKFVPVHKSVLQERGDRVDVVLAHLSDVLKQEAERLEHSVLHVQFWYSVLVHERWQNGERRTGLRDDRYGYCCAHTVLSLLHLQVV